MLGQPLLQPLAAKADASILEVPENRDAVSQIGPVGDRVLGAEVCPAAEGREAVPMPRVARPDVPVAKMPIEGGKETSVAEHRGQGLRVIPADAVGRLRAPCAHGPSALMEANRYLSPFAPIFRADVLEHLVQPDLYAQGGAIPLEAEVVVAAGAVVAWMGSVGVTRILKTVAHRHRRPHQPPTLRGPIDRADSVRSIRSSWDAGPTCRACRSWTPVRFDRAARCGE